MTACCEHPRSEHGRESDFFDTTSRRELQNEDGGTELVGDQDSVETAVRLLNETTPVEEVS